MEVPCLASSESLMPVVRGEQSRRLSPSDPALAPASLMAGPGMWALITKGEVGPEKDGLYAINY